MNDDQHSWTYELYDVVVCKETQEEKTVHASEKGRFMYKYCPELSRQNRTIDSILQHKVLTCYWSKKPEAFSQLFLRKSGKSWHQNFEELWKLNSLKKSFKYLKHGKDRITWLWLCNVLFNYDISDLSHVMTEQSRVNTL